MGDREELRRLRAELVETRALLRQHPLWDNERVLIERRVARIEGRMNDVRGRRAPEEWASLLAHLDPVELARPQIESHYPDALSPMETYDFKRRCRKCGGKAAARYVPDRVRRLCRRCGFSWFELPLDTPLAPQAEEPPPQPEGQGGGSEAGERPGQQ